MPDYRGHEIKLQPGNFGVVLAKVYRDGHLLMVPGGDLHFAELTAEEALRRAKRWIDTKFTDAPNAADEDMDNAMDLSFLGAELREKDEEIALLKKQLAATQALLERRSEIANAGSRGWGISARALERVIKIAKYWRDRSNSLEKVAELALNWMTDPALITTVMRAPTASASEDGRRYGMGLAAGVIVDQLKEALDK